MFGFQNFQPRSFKMPIGSMASDPKVTRIDRSVHTPVEVWSKPACQGVLLTLGDYYGTLAAVRYFGRMGIPVYLAEWRRLVPASLSRYVTEVVRCPNVAHWSEFSAWLLEFGSSRPGLFLYPTSDDTAWIYANHGQELSRFFYMLQPSRATIYSLLNKVKLHELCKQAGLSVPENHLVHSESELLALADRLSYPLLIKPRTQIGSLTHVKGRICQNKAELLAEYPKFMKMNTYDPEIKNFDPEVEWPMIQTFHKDAMGNTLSIAGVILQSGEIFLVRGSKKVMQRPRKLGIGLCFESCTIPESVAEACRNLCQSSGYYGAFELEMIYLKDSDSYLLIDFNPRYYSQMAFEIARDLPIPGLLYAAATGQTPQLQGLVEKARAWKSDITHIYSIKWLFHLFMTTALIGRNIAFKDYLLWLKWLYSKRVRYVDAVMDTGDFMPFLGDAFTQICHYIRHPFSSYRRFFRDN